MTIKQIAENPIDRPCAECGTVPGEACDPFWTAEESSTENFDAVMAALAAHSAKVLAHVAALIINLGSQATWSTEENFCTTEEIASLAAKCGLPSAATGAPAARLFYQRASDQMPAVFPGLG